MVRGARVRASSMLVLLLAVVALWAVRTPSVDATPLSTGPAAATAATPDAGREAQLAAGTPDAGREAQPPVAATARTPDAGREAQPPVELATLARSFGRLPLLLRFTLVTAAMAAAALASQLGLARRRTRYRTLPTPGVRLRLDAPRRGPPLPA
jgi:hypothetical protein